MSEEPFTDFDGILIRFAVTGFADNFSDDSHLILRTNWGKGRGAGRTKTSWLELANGIFPDMCQPVEEKLKNWVVGWRGSHYLVTHWALVTEWWEIVLCITCCVNMYYIIISTIIIFLFYCFSVLVNGFSLNWRVFLCCCFFSPVLSPIL